MSARPCGCDDAAGWICKQHGDDMEAARQFRADLKNRAAVNEMLGHDFMGADIARLDGKLPKWERLDRAERFKARLAAADQMTDTTASAALSNVYAHDEPMPKSAAEQFRAEAVAVADAVEPSNLTPLGQFVVNAVARAHAVQTRDDLLNRIATLETELHAACKASARDGQEMRFLLDLERQRREQFRERIAAITKAFYHAELSISSTQPIIALALELNQDLVERAR